MKNYVCVCVIVEIFSTILINDIVMRKRVIIQVINVNLLPHLRNVSAVKYIMSKDALLPIVPSYK